jgi:hypothetical protein
VLILPPGHAQSVGARRSLRRREKWILGVVLSLTAALVVVVVVAVVSTGHSSGNGCIDVNIPYSIGGQEFYKCGAQARAMCSAVDTPAGFSGKAGAAVAAECRKAGLRVGS